jgi:hypothetical protein
VRVVTVMRHPADLEQQALAQVARAPHRRIKRLHLSQHTLQFLLRGRQVHREGEVVHDGIEITAQIAVLVRFPMRFCPSCSVRSSISRNASWSINTSWKVAPPLSGVSRSSSSALWLFAFSL